MLMKRKPCFRFAFFMLFLTACGAVTPAPPVSAPPPATLEIDGKTQVSGIGSYCWSDGEKPGESVCADLTGIPTAREALLATGSPYRAHFHLPLEIPPDSLYIAVLPAGVEIVGGANAARLWNPGAGWAGELPLKNEIDYQFQEGPGLYVLQLSAHWKNFGDASYGFLVQVGGKAAPTSPPATAAPTTAPLVLQTLSPLMRVGKGAANLLALSNDGRWLAIGTPLGVYLYETATQREAWFRAFDGDLRHLAFRPDGAQLVVGLSGNQMPVVDTQTGKTALILQGEAGLRGVWSPDGKSILTSGECEQVLVWDAQSGQVTHTVQPVKCNDVTPGYVSAFWSGDGRRIYTIYLSGLSIWDATTYQLLVSLRPSDDPEHNFVSLPIPSPTESLLAVSTGLGIDILDGETGKLLRTLAQDPFMGAPLWAVTWSRDGKRLLAAGGGATADTGDWFSIWDVKTGRILSAQKKRAVTDLAFMPDDETLVGVSSSDDTISAVNLTTGKTAFTLNGFGSWNAAKWDGNNLLTFNGVTEARWNPARGEMIEQHVSPEPGWVKAQAAIHSLEGLTALSNAASDIKLKQKLFELHDALMSNNVTWSPNGKRLASNEPYSDALKPVIWDVQTGEALVALNFVGVGQLHPYMEIMEWSSDGKWVAGGGSLMNMNDGSDDGFVVVWDAQTGQQTALLMDGMKSDRIQSVAWSPDQRWLAAGAYSGKIFLWDVQTHSIVAVLIGHAGYVSGLNWSADSTLLASSGDSTVLVWKMP